MFVKFLLSFFVPLAMLIELIAPALSAPIVRDVYIETAPTANELRENKKVDGVNGSRFYIQMPKLSKYQSISSDEFGMSDELADNTEAFVSAIAYCKANPGTRLVIEPGVYCFRTANQLVFDGVKDTLIDGSGAKFIFTVVGQQMIFSHCDTVELYNLTIDWDRENDPIDDVLRVVKSDSKNHTVDFEFPLRTNVNENMIFSAITQCDPENYTFGAKGGCKEVYFYQIPYCLKNTEKINDNTLRITHNGCMDHFSVGEAYILRHHVYDGELFRVKDDSKNITFDGMKLYGSAGTGFVISDGASHFQIINSVIGVDPMLADKHFVSFGADAIHIVNSNGHFLVENCDISRQGDDALNVHDGLGYIDSVEGDTVKMYASSFRMSVGDTIRFKDDKYNDLGYSAKIVSTDTSNVLKVLKFDRDVSSVIKKNYIAYSAEVDSANYVVRNNYIHENRARGLLLQSNNGLCENNRFYKTEMMAIKIIMDIIPSLWQEGTGVDNLVVRNNVFDSCDVINMGEIITIGTSIDGKTATCCPFTNIEISDNTFMNFETKVMNINNVNGIKISENSIIASSKENKIYFGEYCNNITLEENECTGKYACRAEVIKAKKFTDTILLNKLTKEDIALH